MEEKIVYFENVGKENTEEVIGLVLERAKARKVKRIVVASTRGETARAFSAAVEGTDIGLVVVPWQFNYKDKGSPFPAEIVKELRERKHVVHFGTMLFHTVDLYNSNTPQALANILRTFGQGTKVCLEILMMACDGGCVDAGERVIVVAGTIGGADTAFLATAAPSNHVKSLRIHEIICKPIL